MSYIDSSTSRRIASPLEGTGADGDGLDADTEANALAEEPEPRQPRERNGTSLKKLLVDQIDDQNLARWIDDQRLDQIGSDCMIGYRIDERSREEWAQHARMALDFAMQKTMPKTSPWLNASNVVFPLITQATLNFQARTLPAIIQGRSVVKGAVMGDDHGVPLTENGKPDGQQKMAPDPDNPQAPPQPAWITKPGELRERADRVAAHMSYQLLEEMPEWKPQVDIMLMQIPVIGGALKKTYFDTVTARNRSDFVSLLDVVWDYRADAFEVAPRISQRLLRYPHEIIEAENTDINDNGEGVWLHLDYGPGSSGTEPGSDVQEERRFHESNDPAAPHTFIEQHCRIDIDDDGYPEPYIVTIHEQTQKVVRIIARYREKDVYETDDGRIQRVDPADQYTLIPFLPSIDGGSYPTGFGHLLRHLNDAINSTLNQMFDAGTLANTGSGIVGADAGLPSGEIGFKVGKFLRAKPKSGTRLQDNVMMFPFPGPNMALFQLLGMLVSAGKELASIQDILTGDANIANAPPTTILALIEQGMKLNNAIHTRIFWALGQEYKKLFELNRQHLTEPGRFQVAEKWFDISPEDYRLSGGVLPVADPTQTTDMQKLGRAQLVQSIAWGNPLFDQQKVATRILEAGNVERITDLFAAPDQTAQEMAMAKAQAEIGEIRSATVKNTAAAFYSMAQARELANASQQAQIDQQMEYMRLQIENINAATRADAVRIQAHKTALDHIRGMHKLALDAHAASEPDETDETEPTPGPTGPFPTGGPQAVKPPPAPMPPRTDNTGLPPLPGPNDNPLAGAPGTAPPPGPSQP